MSLQLWLPLQGDLKNIGIRALTVDGHSSTVSTTGGKLADKCQSFSRADTPTNYLSFPVFLTANSEFSFCCWFKTNSVAQNQCLYSQRTTGAKSTGFTIFYMGATTGTNADTIRFDDGAGLYSTGKISSTGVWNHVACVRTSTQKLIYLNGILIGSGTRNTATQVNQNYAVIGASQSNAAGTGLDGNGLNGYLQDVRIYDHALSAAEIKELARGLMVHYPLNDWHSDRYNLLSNTATFTTSNWARSNTSQITVPSSGVLKIAVTTSARYARYKTNLNYADYGPGIYTVSYEAREEPVATSGYASAGIYTYIGYIVSSRDSGNNVFNSSYDNYRNITQPSQGTEWHKYSQTFIVPDDLTTGKTAARVAGSHLCVQFGRGKNTYPVYIRNIKLVRGYNAEWAPSQAELGISDTPSKYIDVSGYNNYANKIGTVSIVRDISAKYNYVASIGATASRLEASRYIHTSENKFSFNIWYNPSEYVNSAMAFVIRLNSSLLFNFGNTGSTDSYSHQFIVFRSSNYIAYKNFTIPTNEWHMWTGTYDGTTVKLYKDGQLLGSNTTTTSYSVGTTERYHLLGAPGDYTNIAKASDIRIYATVLDIDTIRQLYETGAKIDNQKRIHTYEFVEGQNKTKITKTGLVSCSELNEQVSTLAFNSDLTIDADEFIEC